MGIFQIYLNFQNFSESVTIHSIDLCHAKYFETLLWQSNIRVFAVTNIRFTCRSLPQPLMTYDLHYKFIQAASKLFLHIFWFLGSYRQKMNWTAWFPIPIALAEQTLREHTKVPDLNCFSELDHLNRVRVIHYLIHQLPEANFEMLDLLCKHLNK